MNYKSMNNMKLFGKILCLTVLAMCLAACEKPEPDVTPVDSIPVNPTDSPHALILNEGSWGGNNASISYLDLSAGTLENGWFSRINNRGLGDLAQDLVVYGAKAYVTVSESESLEVIDTATGVATRVDLGQRYPRYIAAEGGKLYITCYKPHSVIRIDTATLEVEATCTLGNFNPEGIAAVGGKLLVASSSISDEQGNYSYDNMVYAIDIASFSLIGTIPVGYNPQKILALGNNTAVVNYIGDYASQPAGSAVIEASLAVTQLGQELTNMTVADGIIYGYYTAWAADYSSKTTNFVKIDAARNITPILPGKDINAYAIGVHPVSGNLYIADDGNYTSNGDLHCFSPDGTLRWKREVGMMPSKIVFL